MKMKMPMGESPMMKPMMPKGKKLPPAMAKKGAASKRPPMKASKKGY